VHALRPLLDRFGNERKLTLILFTLDESSYSRELAPLAGHYPISSSARPGGSTTVPKACAASAS
jgi:glucuronate isomerase